MWYKTFTVEHVSLYLTDPSIRFLLCSVQEKQKKKEKEKATTISSA